MLSLTMNGIVLADDTLSVRHPVGVCCSELQNPEVPEDFILSFPLGFCEFHVVEIAVTSSLRVQPLNVCILLLLFVTVVSVFLSFLA